MTSIWNDNNELRVQDTNFSAEQDEFPVLVSDDCRNSASDAAEKDRRKCTQFKIKYVYFAIVAAFGSLGFGFTVVYSSPFLEDMSRRTNFTLWTEGFENCIYQNLVGPLTPIGAVVGGLLSSLVIGVFGLVFSLITAAVMFVVGWAMIGVSWFVSSPDWFRFLILTGRFVTGASAGGVAATIPIYVAEISPTQEVRGKLGVLFPAGIGLGIFACFVIGNYISYWQLAFLVSGLFVIQSGFLFTIQEPAMRSRNVVKNFKNYCHKDSDEKMSRVFINERFFWSAFLVGTLFSLQQLTGINATSFYASPIFLSAGGDNWAISPGLAASISIGLTLIFVNIGTVFFVNKVGRTILFFFGALGMMIGNIGIGSYFAIVNGVLPAPTAQAANESSLCFFGVAATTDPGLAAQYSSLAIISVAVFVVSFAAGWSLPLYVYAPELFPRESRGVGLGIAIASNWLSTALVTFLFPLSTQHIGPALSFFILAAIAGIAAVFVPFFVPEMKGKEMGSIRGFTLRGNLKEFFHHLKMCICCNNWFREHVFSKRRVVITT